MFNQIRWVVAFGALAPVVACGGNGELVDEGESTDIFDANTAPAVADENGEGGGPAATLLGHARQAQIDTGSSECFGSVPPFIQPRDFFELTIDESFIPTSLCASDVYFFMVENLVKELGIPHIRPNEAPAVNCADLQVFFAIGRINGVNERPTIVAQGSKRGSVVVRDGGALFCDITLPVRPSNLNSMPDGADYIFAVQALDDDGEPGVSEDVLVFK